MRRLTVGLMAAAGLWAAAGSPVHAAPVPWEASILATYVPSALDRDFPGRVQLVECVSVKDRDCIETVGLVTPNRFVPGEVIFTGPREVIGPIEPGGEESGPTTGRWVTQSQTWRIPGFRNHAGEDTLSPFIALTTPGMRWFAADQGIEYDVTSQLEFELGSQRSVSLAPQHSSPMLRAVVRTSWFSPAWARSHLGNTILKVEPLPGEGSRITVQGRALNSPGFSFGEGLDPNLENRRNFDFYDYRWTVYMLDANDGKFPMRCAQFGFPLISGNQWGAGTPTWDSQSQRLDLHMSAPHYDGEGNVFRGHYEAFIPGKYARCLWGTDPSLLTKRLIVEVIAESGEEQAATTSIGYREGGVRIVARNFSFSRPTVSVWRK